jgi:hypothetical protein
MDKTFKKICSGVPTRSRGHRSTGQPKRLVSGYYKQDFNSLAASVSGPACSCGSVQHLRHSRCRTQQVSAFGRRDMLEIDVNIDLRFASSTLYLRACECVCWKGVKPRADAKTRAAGVCHKHASTEHRDSAVAGALRADKPQCWFLVTPCAALDCKLGCIAHSHHCDTWKHSYMCTSSAKCGRPSNLRRLTAASAG